MQQLKELNCFATAVCIQFRLIIAASRGALPEIRSVQIRRFLSPLKNVVVNLGQIGSQLSLTTVVRKTERETIWTLQNL